jgi:hypothetical protein
MQTSILIRRLTGTGKGKEENLMTQEISFGTGPHNTQRFDSTWDRGVAISHARAYRDEAGQWWVQDAGSSTGTYVNGQRITTKRQIGGPTVIELGQNGPKVEIVLPPPLSKGKRSTGGGSSIKWLAVAACLALLGAGAWYFSPIKGSRGSQIAWSPQVDMGGQIFPSYLIAIATMNPTELPNAQISKRLGDPAGVIGARVTSPHDDARVRVAVEGNAIMKGGSIEVNLPQMGEEYVVYPKIEYHYNALLQVRQAVPLTLTLSVALEGVEESAATTVRVSSINDCPFVVSDTVSPDGQKIVPFTWMFAAYVNENHPFSEEVRKAALQTRLIDSFDGYQGGPDGVLPQVFAIWNVLQQRGVRYSNATTTSAESGDVFAQQVRFLDQAITSAQANCVDGSVIFASILRQIGIEPVLVVVPGHMFVGFFLDPSEDNSLVFLETTAMGSTDLSQIASLKGLSGALQSGMEKISNKSLTDAQIRASADSFLNAIARGNQTFKENQQSVLNQEGTSGLIEIRQARKRGVMPIAYQP